MKKFTLFFFALAMLFGVSAFAQEPNDQCKLYLDFYSNNYKNKQYDDALPQWRIAYRECPRNYRANIYIQGSFLLNRQINKTRDAALKEAMIDSLLTLQDERLQYFPTGKIKGEVQDLRATILNNKGQYAINFRGNNPEFLYKTLGEIIDQIGSQTKGGIFVNYLQSAIALYKAGNLDVEEVINAYTKSSECLKNAEAADDAEATSIGEAKATLESIFAESNVASCDNLVAIFKPRYEANPEDVSTVNTIVRLMNRGECFDNDLYLNAVTALHKLDPSANSAYFLYRLHSARGNVSEAILYIEEAIASSAADDVKAQYNYELANFAYKNSLKSKAYSAAGAAAALDCGYAGKAYMIMGNIWASTSCSGDVAKYGRYWVATDFYQKARNADPSLASDASSAISSVARYYPEYSEIFMYNITAGQSYSVSCGGMSASTTVRVR